MDRLAQTSVLRVAEPGICASATRETVEGACRLQVVVSEHSFSALEGLEAQRLGLVVSDPGTRTGWPGCSKSRGRRTGDTEMGGLVQ